MGSGGSSSGGSGIGSGGSSSGSSGMSSGGSGGYSSGSSSSSSGGSLSGGSSMSGGMDSEGTVHRVAQAAHQYVDKLEQTLGSSGDRVMSMQQEYGEMAREHVKTNPLQSIGIAFAVGVLFSKLFMR
jgi:ElaB/YqjD/DUF883 family membrane-anchored ribosome-binding protein